MIELHVLNNLRGGKNFFVQDEDNPKQRSRLAKIVKDLVRRGHSVFISKSKGSTIDVDNTSRVKDYDPKTNEWIFYRKRGEKKSLRRPAAGTTVTAVAPPAGG
jgi:hypothetical protein